jgi:hypothetical protein
MRGMPILANLLLGKSIYCSMKSVSILDEASAAIKKRLRSMHDHRLFVCG